MGTVVVVGEPGRIEPFGLAGARVVGITDRESMATSCGTLPADVAVVILTPRAAAWGAGDLVGADVLTVVLPDRPRHAP